MHHQQIFCKQLIWNETKRELTFILPYLGKLSFDLRTRYRWNIKRDLPYCKLKIIFRSRYRLHTLFRFKDPLEKKIRSGIIHCYTCSNCKVTYYGKTFCHIPERLNTWGSPILHENASKTLNSLQYLTIYCSVIAP